MSKITLNGAKPQDPEDGKTSSARGLPEALWVIPDQFAALIGALKQPLYWQCPTLWRRASSDQSHKENVSWPQPSSVSG